MGNVDLHFHLLPGIDDGPATMDESIELARVAESEGTDTIVATPHVKPRCVTDPSGLCDRVIEVREALARANIGLAVKCGGELDPEMVPRLSQRQLDLIAHGPPRRRWLLLEAPLSGFDEAFTAAADELRARGFAVVLAHPERALANNRGNWRVLEHELAAGSALQLNAWSVAGLYGDRVRSIALQLLDPCRRVVIASDAHGVTRSPSLLLALDSLTTIGLLDARGLVAAEPRSLLTFGLATRSSVAVA